MPDNYVKKHYDCCIVCGQEKKDKNKTPCRSVWGPELVNGGRHQYIGLVPPEDNA